MDNGIEIAAGFDIVEASDYHFEFRVEAVLHFLDSAGMGDYFHPWASLHHEVCHHLGFFLIDVLASEEELSVKVSQIDGIHINEMNIPNATEGQVLDNLTAKPTGPNNQYFLIHQALKHIFVPVLFELVLQERRGLPEEGLEVAE